MLILFTIGVLLYALGVRVAALFGHSKAKSWVEGRCSSSLSKYPPENDGDWIWFHAASLGEFEQGRPVIEALKRDYPQCKILLSFFSPSGYEIRKDYPLADEVLYLPSDTPKNAAAWVGRHHFVAAFFIKYEFWFNYMRALKKAGVPLYYISLILNEKTFFLKPFGKWFRKQLVAVSHFFVQDEVTASLLHRMGYDNVTVCGDTRFDRVAAIARQAQSFPEIERFIAGRKCVVAGSTWPPDENLIAGFLPQLPDDYCLVVAPHDVSEGHVAQIQTLFPEAQLYSELDTNKPLRILIINTIGILSQLYQYARFAYVGGGFGAGIHNIQEPVTFGCPVVFGPKHQKFKEAVDLVALGGAFAIESQSDFDHAFSRLISDETFYDAASSICRDYLQSQLGATETILNTLPSDLLEG